MISTHLNGPPAEAAIKVVHAAVGALLHLRLSLSP